VATILLIEPEEPLRLLLTKILQGKGWIVYAAESGQTALEFCGQFEGCIDVLITDLSYTHPISGAQLARMLLFRYPQMRIIILSVYGQEVLAHHISAPKHVFLQKPLSGALVVDKVVDLLQEKSGDTGSA
jgi:two-component system cell cycle sensor histidine kinase/response regulator CckA